MADPVRPLRDRTETTRILILASLQEGATLSATGARLGITVQAVSAHARSLAASGLLSAEGGTYRVTARGLQALHEGVRLLRDAVAALAAPLDVIQVASAVAGASLRTGQEVGLWMVDGDLEARPLSGKADPGSRGRMRKDAAAGEEAIVADLKGVVRLEPGTLRVVSVPSPAEGGTARVDAAKLATTLRGGAWDKVGALGTGPRILARRLAELGALGERQRADFEFSADQAAFNAAERGLSAVLLVSRDRLAEAMQSFERLNARTLRRVPVELVEAPER